MQITGQKPTWFDGNGDPLVGGKVYFYETGTSTPIAIFSDADLTAAADNPVVLDSRGQPSTALFVADGQVYDVFVYDVDDVLQESALEITAPLATGSTPFASTAETMAGVVSTKAVTPAGGAATYPRLAEINAFIMGNFVQQRHVPPVAGVVDINLNQGNVFKIGTGTPRLLTENITINNPAALNSGQCFVLHWRQDATGGRTVTWGSKFKFPSGGAALSTAANARNKVTCLYDVNDDVYLCEIAPNYT